MSVRQWFSNHTPTAKTIVSAWLFTSGLFAVNVEFRSYIWEIYNALPTGLHRFIAAVIIPALIFWKTQKRTTAMAEVGNVPATATASEGSLLGGVKTNVGACIAALLISSMMFTTVGCTKTQVKQAAAQIAAAIPQVNVYVGLAADAAASLGDPATATLIEGVDASVQAGMVVLAGLCTSYANNPDATVWASIQQVVNDLVNKGAASLLDAAKIENSDSRLKAKLVLGAIQTALLIVDGIIQQTRSAKVNAAVASLRQIKINQYADALDSHQIYVATGLPLSLAVHYETALGF